MKLIKCYVMGFGTLSNFSTDFRPGLNCILSDNGTGKSTLAAFIRAMLYGLSDTRKTSLDENERRKYKPWDGRAFGGSLTFEYRGRSYTVERSFAQRASSDTFRLINSDTGAVCHDFSENLGEELFGLDRDGFAATILLSEGGVCNHRAYSTVAAKLADFTSADGRLNEYEAAQKILDEDRKFYFKRGGGGEIALAKERLSKCEEMLADIDNSELRARALAEKISALRRSIAELNEEKKKSTKALAGSGVGSERRAGLERELGEQETAYNKCIDFFKGTLPDRAELRRAREDYERARLAKSNADACPTARFADSVSPKKVKKHRFRQLTNLFYLLFGFFLAVSGILLGIKEPLLYSCTAIGALISVFGTVRLLLDYKKRKVKGATLTCQEDCTAKQTDRTQALFGSYADILSGYAVTDNDPFRQIIAMLDEAEYRERMISRLRAELANCPDNSNATSEYELMLKIKNEDEQLDLLKTTLAVAEREYRELEAKIDSKDSLLSDKSSLTKLISTYTLHLEAIQKASELLREASEKMTFRYIGTAREKFDRYRSLVDSRGGEFNLDTDFRLTKTELGVVRAEESYSRGERELNALALQLALTDSLFRTDTPFIILDDPFCTMDDEKCARGMQMLKEISKERQILYFTCSSARAF